MEASGYDRAPFIPDFYDHVIPYATRPDVGFYIQAAIDSGGPVLELGCGTGRIAIPTARSRIEVSGLDVSARHARCVPAQAASRAARRAEPREPASGGHAPLRSQARLPPGDDSVPPVP